MLSTTGVGRSSHVSRVVIALLSIYIRDEMRHGISDTTESLLTAVPRVDPQNLLQNGLSCACFTDSGQFQGMLMQFVSSWGSNISHQSP